MKPQKILLDFLSKNGFRRRRLVWSALESVQPDKIHPMQGFMFGAFRLPLPAYLVCMVN